MPRRIYSSVESEAMREADMDLLRLLGLSQFNDEAGPAEEQGEAVADSRRQEVDQDAATVISGTDRGNTTGQSQSSNKRSVTSSGRSDRSSGFNSEVIYSYLEAKKGTDEKKMEAKSRRLDLQDKEEQRLERRMKLEEQQSKHQLQMHRAEIIATFVKAGLSLEQATIAYHEGIAEQERALNSRQQDTDPSGATAECRSNGEGENAPLGCPFCVSVFL